MSGLTEFRILAYIVDIQIQKATVQSSVADPDPSRSELIIQIQIPPLVSTKTNHQNVQQVISIKAMSKII